MSRGRPFDTDDMANYFGCSNFDVKTLSAALKSLTEKGFITIEEDSVFPLPQYAFAVGIQEAIEENREVCPQPIITNNDYSQFKFCSEVHTLICSRKQNKLATAALFSEVQRLEQEHSNLEFVSTVKAEVTEVRHRIIVYDLSHKFAIGRGSEIEMRAIFSAMYSDLMQAAHEQRELRVDKHQLKELGYVCIENGDKVKIDDHCCVCSMAKLPRHISSTLAKKTATPLFSQSPPCSTIVPSSAKSHRPKKCTRPTRLRKETSASLWSSAFSSWCRRARSAWFSM